MYTSRVLKLSLSWALTLGLLCPLPSMNLQVQAEDQAPFKGSVIKTDKRPGLPTVNENDIKAVPTGTPMEMVISTSVTPGVNISGDEFFGTISKDVVVDGKVVIPKRTIVHGVVEEMKKPGRAGRNGYISTRFDYLITPDGREISIEGNATTKDSAAKAAAKVVGRASGYTAVGGALGAIMVLKYGGLAAIAASNGYALAGGAAVGGTIGLTAAMLTKGKNAMLQPGAEISIKLNEDLHLPTMNMPDAAAENLVLEGLKVKVLGMRLDKDPFGEMNEINLTVDITNQTENTFSSFEIGLEDEFGNVFYPSPFGDTGMWFSKITPNSHCTSNITFNVDNIKLPHKLVFFKQYTREALAKISLTDGMILDKKQFKKQQAKISNE